MASYFYPVHYEPRVVFGTGEVGIFVDFTYLVLIVRDVRACRLGNPELDKCWYWSIQKIDFREKQSAIDKKTNWQENENKNHKI